MDLEVRADKGAVDVLLDYGLAGEGTRGPLELCASAAEGRIGLPREVADVEEGQASPAPGREQRRDGLLGARVVAAAEAWVSMPRCTSMTRRAVRPAARSMAWG
jgi:hypothetical protein